MLRSVVTIALGGILISCQSPRREVEASSPQSTSAAPSEAKATSEDVGGSSVWAHLSTRYDVDGDRQIRRDEYRRGDEKFARLDGDHDGVLTPADFERAARSSARGPLAKDLPRLVFLQTFQADADKDKLTRAELEASFAHFDLNGDDLIERAEFDEVEADDHAVGTQDPSARGEEADPFDLLARALDPDNDDLLSLEKVLLYFDEQDRSHKGVLDLRGGGPPDPQRESGPAEGAPAPDFTLEPTPEGATVTLSAWREVKPVALIFGSFT